MAECAAANVKGAVIISAGFKEAGPAGADLGKEILAHRGRMRIIGPNCVGVMLPHIGLNATFAKPLALPGNIGFISQSGALCTSILDWSLSNRVGFSAFISIGSMLDVDWGDLIYHLGDDPHTRSILLYMESVGDARSFLSAAREVALTKPIIVIKVGHSAAGAKAAASHTGALTGSDEVLDAAFRRVGVLRADTIGGTVRSHRAPRQTAPAVRAAAGHRHQRRRAGSAGDRRLNRVRRQTGRIISGNFREIKSAACRPTGAAATPSTSWATPAPNVIKKRSSIVARDLNNDGLLAILAPQAMTDPSATAEKVAAVRNTQDEAFPGQLDRRELRLPPASPS